MCKPLRRIRECETSHLILNLGTIWMCGHHQAFRKQPPMHTEQKAGRAMELAWTLWRNKKYLVLTRNEITIPWLSSLQPSPYTGEVNLVSSCTKDPLFHCFATPVSRFKKFTSFRTKTVCLHRCHLPYRKHKLGPYI